MPNNRPIGIFDSGVGGLTVLRAVHSLLPSESTLYVGDLARCPYGPRPLSEVKKFALEIGDFLAHEDIKALLIACNTATAAAFQFLRDRFPFPVIGVIEPGAREAARSTTNGKIGVIATDGTVASGAYDKAIKAMLPSADVFERSASWLVPIIERGVLARPRLHVQLAETMADLRESSIDTLILGCTHFPIVRDIFDAGAGDAIDVLDSADTTARELARVLESKELLSAGPAWHRILVTGPAEAFAERAQAMFRTSPEIETLDLVPRVVTGA